MIQLNYEGRVFNGAQGSLTGLCEDKLRFQAFVDTISVTAGDTIAVQIDADEPPERLTASIYETESESKVSTAALDADLSPSFKIDLQAGVYNVILQGSWEEWSVEYEFRIEAVALVSRLHSAEPMAGSCLPAAQEAVSWGATWTISGRANIPVVFLGGVPEGTSEMSTTFVVTDFGTESSAAGTSGATAEHPTVELAVKAVARDEDGSVLSADDGVLTRSPVSVVGNISPVLTMDWDCHKKAWLDAWPSEEQPAVGERSLSTGITAIVFSVARVDGTLERHRGYDKLTGRIVLNETQMAGDAYGQSSSMGMLQELVPGGSTTAISAVDPGACGEYMELLISFDGKRAEERAVVTSYRCGAAHVGSTGRSPSRSPTILASNGESVSFRLAAGAPPVGLDVRLYSGSFGQWPEELQTGVKPTDTLRPSPSLTFEFIPHQPPGEYSLVLRANWAGPVDVFYAMSFILE